MRRHLVILFIFLFVITLAMPVFGQEIPIEETPPIEEVVKDPVEEPVVDPIDPQPEEAEEPIEPPIEDPVEEMIEELVEEIIPIEEPSEEEAEEDEIAEELFLYFSEIAWMGTIVSTSDEWIEIYNPNDFEVDLNGWLISSSNSDFEIELSGVVGPSSYYLLERTDDSTVGDIEADQIYTGALKNDGVYLQLVDTEERIIDEIDDWHAGDNDSKTTMSREYYDIAGIDSSAWCTSDTNSPKEENNCYIPIEEVVDDSIEEPIEEVEYPIEDPVVNNPPVPAIEIQGDTNYMHVNVTGEDSYDPDGDNLTYFWDYGDGTINETENPKSYYYDSPGEKIITLTVTDELGLSTSVSAIFVAKEKVIVVSSGSSSLNEPNVIFKSYNVGDIIIDSALPNPDGTDSGAEAIIFKNESNETIDLNGWKLVDAKDNTKTFDSMSLPAQSSLQIKQDVFKIGLNNDEETLYLYDPVGNLISEMHWEDAKSGQWILNLYFLYDGINGMVSNVVDGDTFDIVLGDREMRVRLIGIDAPETVNPYGPVEEGGYVASDFLSDLIENKVVSLTFDENKTDIYGRLLAYAYLNELFVNKEIIEQGYSEVYTKYPFKYMDEFLSYGNGTGEVIQEEVSEEIIDEQVVIIDEEYIEKSIAGVNCNSDYLKIDSILPAPQKGEAIEFIRLINTGEDTVCLNGWVLDDIVGGGSKPFSIRGGSVAGGAMRTFRKDETSIALNNSNDCAYLINPQGEVADQICYGKTHKNEIFTHGGGDWIPKPRTSTSSKTKSVKSVKRDAISYQYDLKTEKAIGSLELVYEDGELIYLSLEDHSVIQISYASSSVDVSMAKQLLDITQPIEVSYLSGGEMNQLISINQVQQKEEQIERSRSYLYILLLIPIVAVAFFLKRKFR